MDKIKSTFRQMIKERKGQCIYLAMGQSAQSLLLCALFTSGIQSCKAWNLASEACPSLRRQRYGLVMIGTSKTLLTKELK